MNTEHDAQPGAARDPLALALGQRIQDARGTQLQRDVAQLVGVHSNTFGKWERGETVPDVLQLQRIAAVLGVEVMHFLGASVREERATYDVGVPANTTRAVRRGEYLYVPLYDMRNWAEAGADEDVALVLGMHCFRRDYLARDVGIAHEALLLVQMHGSMAEPAISAGDLVLVDRNDAGGEGHHLVRVDDTVSIKMIHRRPGRLVVSNNGHAAFEVELDGPERGDFEILGRCRWVGSKLS